MQLDSRVDQIRSGSRAILQLVCNECGGEDDKKRDSGSWRTKTYTDCACSGNEGNLGKKKKSEG